MNIPESTEIKLRLPPVFAKGSSGAGESTAANVAGPTPAGSKTSTSDSRSSVRAPHPAPRRNREHTRQPSRSWLDDDPYNWVGRKIRNRASRTTYTVRRVLKNGRVELEKSWMVYLFDVDTIRRNFETSI
jgi:hypothetical protein